MGSGYLLNPVIFLIDTLLGLYILIVMLRFMLQLVRADFYNPVSQFIVKASNPPLKPLRRIIPGWGGIDFASVVLIFCLQLALLAILAMLNGDMLEMLTIPGLLMATVTRLVLLTLNIYLFSIIIIVILSWVSPGTYNPVAALLASLTDPLMRPARRLIPPMGGLDLSPMAVMLAIYVVGMLVVPLLYRLTFSLGFPLALLGRPMFFPV